MAIYVLREQQLNLKHPVTFGRLNATVSRIWAGHIRTLYSDFYI